MTVASSYEKLGIPCNSSEKEVRKAYRRLAKKFHPDLNPGDIFAITKFREITEAYNAISSQSDPFTPIVDIGSWISRKPHTKRPQVCRNIKVSCRITMAEAYAGGKMRIKYLKTGICSECDGSGVDVSASPKECFLCSGTGKFANGTCWVCNGGGKERRKCGACVGQGWVHKECELEVDIPPKTKPMSQIVVKGAGNEGPMKGFAPGDLCVYVTYGDSDSDSAITMQPDGTLLWKVWIPWQTTLLGTIYPLRPFGLKDTISVTLDPKAEDGRIYTVDNCGMFDGKPLLVKVFHILPLNMSLEDREAVAEVLKKYAL